MSKRLSGMFKDADSVDLPEGYYLHGQNIVVEESLGAIVNELGTELKSSSIPIDNKVIGQQLLGDEKVVLFSVNDTKDNCEIGVFQDETYTTLVNSSKLNFHFNYKIQSDTLINQYDEQIVMWVDGLNSPRWLNVSNPTSNVDYMSIFPYSENTPIVKIKSINSDGGNLKEGVYYFAVSYLDNDSDDILTNFYNVTGPISVRPSFENAGSSSITISINEIDQNYKNLQIAVIKKIDNIIDEVELLPVLPSSITEYTYTGREGVRPGALEEIQIDKAFYSKAKTLHLNDDILYMGNMGDSRDIGYQPYANNIKVHLAQDPPPDIVLNDVNEWEHGSSITNQYYKGYFKGETYAVYISWLLKNGGESKAYHIPGRVADNSLSDTEIIEDTGRPSRATFILVAEPTSNTTIDIEFDGERTSIDVLGSDDRADVARKIETKINNDSNAKAYVSTANDRRILFVDKQSRELPTGTIISAFVDLSDWNNINPFMSMDELMMGGINPGESGYIDNSFYYESTKDPIYNMGYWENSDEYYPDSIDWVIKNENGVIVGDLRDKNVRHHNIPDVKNLSNDYKYDRPVGLKLKNVIIPEEIRDNVIGYKVYYAEHNEENRKILDQAIICNSLVDENGDINNNDYYTNSPHNDPDQPNNNDYRVDPKTHYVYPFNLLRKRTSIESLNHIQILGNTTTNETNTIEVSPPWEDGGTHIHQLKEIDHFANHPTDYHGLINVKLEAKTYVDSSENKNSINLKSFGFPYNMNNYSGVSTLVLRTQEELDTDHYYLANLRVLRRNLYSPFDQQPLVFTGYIHTDINDTDSDTIYGGDAFTQQPYTFKANRTPKDYTQVGVHTFNKYQSYDNLYMRKFGENSWENYYPKVDAFALSAMYFSEDGTPLYTTITNSEGYAFKKTDNYLGYDEGESSVNNIKFPEIHKKYPRRIKNYLTRVIRSQNNFRLFLQDDYIDLSKKRGQLIKLTTYNNVLIPHMERAIVRTRGKEELRTNEITAFLGSGDIFSVKPEEIIYTKDGFAGLLDKTHSLSTPYGYFFFDAFANRVYNLDNNGLKDISEGILSEIRDLSFVTQILPPPINFQVEIEGLDFIQ